MLICCPWRNITRLYLFSLLSRLGRSDVYRWFVKVKRRSIFVSCTCVFISTARTLKQPVRLVAVAVCIACLFLRCNACLRFVKVKRRNIFVSCTCVFISTARTLKQPIRLVAVTACIACLFLRSGLRRSNACLRFVKVKRRNVFVSCACIIINTAPTFKQPVRLAVCGIPLCTVLLYRSGRSCHVLLLIISGCDFIFYPVQRICNNILRSVAGYAYGLCGLRRYMLFCAFAGLHCGSRLNAYLAVTQLVEPVLQFFKP